MAFSDALVVVVCLAAIGTDMRWRRIPNWLTFPAMGLGLLVNALEGGWNGLVRGAAGLLLALLLTVPLFALGFVKAGDVKLVAAFGIIKGVGATTVQSFALWAFLYGALIGGLWALMTLAQSRSLGLAWMRVREIAIQWLGGMVPTGSGGSRESALRQPMPYGVALSLGALMALACERLWGHPFPLLGG